MTELYKSSALAGGNHVAQDSIELHDNYLTWIKGGIFKSKELQIPYKNIHDISVHTPLVGFASIEFWAYGVGKVVVKGLTKDAARRIRDVISGHVTTTKYRGIYDDDLGQFMMNIAEIGTLSDEARGTLRKKAEDEDENPDEVEVVMESMLWAKVNHVDHNKAAQKENPLYDEELSYVINCAAMDGNVDDRERGVVSARAADDGENPREAVMVLEAMAFANRNNMSLSIKKKEKYSEELEYLMDCALLDGNLTFAKKIIVKERAEEHEGEDWNEVETELETRAYMASYRAQSAAQSRQTTVTAEPVKPSSPTGMSQQLKDLMEMAVSGGEISEKSRNVLIKRAVSEGLDPDEFEMILDAKISKTKNANN